MDGPAIIIRPRSWQVVHQPALSARPRWKPPYNPSVEPANNGLGRRCLSLSFSIRMEKDGSTPVIPVIYQSFTSHLPGRSISQTCPSRILMFPGELSALAWCSSRFARKELQAPMGNDPFVEDKLMIYMTSR